MNIFITNSKNIYKTGAKAHSSAMLWVGKFTQNSYKNIIWLIFKFKLS